MDEKLFKILFDGACPVCLELPIPGVVLGYGLVTEKPLDMIQYRNRHIPSAHTRLTHWGTHDRGILPDWALEHETMMYGHWHYHEYRGPDDVYYYRYDGVDMTRLELEVVHGIMNVLTRFNIGRKDRHDDRMPTPHDVRMDTWKVELKRLVPFPLPLSRLKSRIRERFWKGICNAMYMISRVLQFKADDWLGMTHSYLAPPAFCEKLEQDIVEITDLVNLGDNFRRYTLVRVKCDLVESVPTGMIHRFMSLLKED
jgi:hypothetical protein